MDLSTADKMPLAAMGSNFVGLFLMSWFVGVTAVSEALLTVLLATLAFVVLAYSGDMFAQKSAAARAINAGYWIASLAIMIGFQAIF